MGMDISISKHENIQPSEFDIDCPTIGGEEICYWRKHYWLHDWFRDNCELKGGYCDEFVISKEEVVKFYDYCLDLINYGYEKYCDSEDFYCVSYHMANENWKEEDIYKEISTVISDIAILLREDFDNNTFVYEMSC